MRERSRPSRAAASATDSVLPIDAGATAGGLAVDLQRAPVTAAIYVATARTYVVGRSWGGGTPPEYRTLFALRQNAPLHKYTTARRRQAPAKPRVGQFQTN